jgi:phosphoribosyl-ATP pyrophosphohydrolase
MSEPDDTADGDGSSGDASVDGEAADSEAPEAVLDSLFETIQQRQATLPEDSYTASLFTHEKGENAVLEKLGEESTELILAAKDDDLENLTAESADFCYHLLVLFAMKGLTVEELRAELESRF